MAEADAGDSNVPPKPDEPHGEERVLVFDYPPGAEFYILAGYSAIYTLPDRPDLVLKIPKPHDDYKAAHEIERRIYQRLGKHPNIVTVAGMDKYGIYLHRAEHGCLRLYYRDGGTATTSEEKVKWSQDVAEALEHLHRNNVRHADLSGRNLLVDSQRNILLCDFGGSSIDDEPAVVIAEAGYRHPDESEYRKPTIRGELHALGSTIYEIVTGNQPHEGRADWEVRSLSRKDNTQT